MDFESFAAEYAGSQQFLLLDSPVKSQAAELLGLFSDGCRQRNMTPATFTIDGLEEVLTGSMARCDMPLYVRKEVPELLCGFFDYLAVSGSFPPAGDWTAWVNSLRGKYLMRFREDGSVRGETFRKKYSDVCRNDPCPCGSGKKFKKCCMGLISRPPARAEEI